MNLILALLLIHYAAIIIFKPRIDTLACGIFAWAGKNPKRFNKSNLDILGIMNEERGTHSCGITIDGEIQIGVDSNKIYRNFISNSKLALPKLYPTVIGHTRHSTYGAHTIANAHPFGFGLHNGGFKFIGVHNGTLLDYKDIAEEFNLKVNTSTKEKNANNRTKIDSEVLLEAIYRSKSFTPLEKYNGAAALVFTNTEEPNVIYCYHGASKKYSGDSEKAALVIERPLFYYKNSKNSLYISSIKESLFAIGGTDKNVAEFDTNIVYKITDGDVDNAEKIAITRIGNYITKSTGSGYGNSSTYKGYEYGDDYYDIPYKTPSKSFQLPMKSSISTPISESNIYAEVPNGKEKSGKVYVNQLRYFNGTEAISGCYTWIPGFGFYYLADNLSKALSVSLLLVGRLFLNTEFVIDKEASSSKEAFIPFPDTKDSIDRNVPMFYFSNGIRLKNRLDYTAVNDLEKMGKSFDWLALTEAAAHPIIEDVRYKSASIQNIMQDGQLVTDTFSLLGSDKIYTVEEGNCIKIEDAKVYTDDNVKRVLNDSQTKLFQVDTLALAYNAIEDSEIQREIEESKNEDKLVTNDLLETELNSIFFAPFSKFQEDIKNLERYSHLIKAKDAMGILVDFIEETKGLIQLEIKE